MVSIFALFVCLLVLALLKVLYRPFREAIAFQIASRRYGCRHPPSYPSKDPIFGWDLFRDREEAIKSGRQNPSQLIQFEKYGKTYQEHFFGHRIINTMQPENVQHVLARAPEDYQRSGGRAASLMPFLGEGITTSDGAAWRHARGLVRPVFARSEVADIDPLETFFQRFLAKIPRDGSAFDIQPLLHKLFLDISTNFIFGESVHSLLPDTPYDSAALLKSFNIALAGAGLRRRRNWLLNFWYSSDEKWHRAIAAVHEFVDAKVLKALQETTLQTGSDEDFKRDDPPQKRRYILLYEMAKQIRDPVQLRYQILSAFTPARDTASILVSNILFHLARNPIYWSELRAEALAIGENPLTFERLRTLKTFRHVMVEAHRVQGPSGRTIRSAACDTVLPVGGGADGKSPVFVPKGATVSLNKWSMHHDKDIWGSNANDFRPERWQHRGPPMWEFLPFGGGPRICPAQQQVITQTLYILVRLTREFKMIQNRDPVLEYVEEVKMTTESRNGVQITLIPA